MIPGGSGLVAWFTMDKDAIKALVKSLTSNSVKEIQQGLDGIEHDLKVPYNGGEQRLPCAVLLLTLRSVGGWLACRSMLLLLVQPKGSVHTWKRWMIWVVLQSWRS